LCCVASLVNTTIRSSNPWTTVRYNLQVFDYMKRLHLFEIEDLAGCPAWIRDCVTAMIVVVHRWFGVPQVVAEQLELILADFGDEAEVTIVDTCSGNGGPMPDALRLLASTQGQGRSIQLLLTDKRPPSRLVAELNEQKQSDLDLQYLDRSVDACLPLMEQLSVVETGHVGKMSVGDSPSIVRTLVCGFHHLAPEQARTFLLDAQQANQPLVIFELTNGTVPPRWLWWATLLPNFIFGLFVSVFARPLSIRGIVFSFLLPIIPACFAWDGAVTSARIYREGEFHAMLETLPKTDNYRWQFLTGPGPVVEYSLIVGRPIIK